MRTLLRRLQRVPDWLPPLEHAWFRTGVWVTLIAAVVHLALAALFVSQRVWPLVALELAAAALFVLLVPVLRRAGVGLVSATSHLEANAHVLLLTWLYPGSAFELYLFTMLAVPTLLFPPRDPLHRAALAALPVVTFLLHGQLDAAPPRWTALPAAPLTVLRPVNVVGAFGTLAACAFLFRSISRQVEVDLEHARQKNWDLLRNVLPERIAAQLRDHPGVIAESHDAVTVVFADIVGFVRLTTTMEPAALVRLLNDVFSAFDRLAAEHRVEKIKTIGDAYMAAAGMPGTAPDHAVAVCRLAKAMVASLASARARHGVDLHLRVGVHTGPVMAGVIGERGFRFDLWGDTVNVASRMESSGVPDRVQISAATLALLGADARVEARGEVALKGKGPTSAWLLAG